MHGNDMVYNPFVFGKTVITLMTQQQSFTNTLLFETIACEVTKLHSRVRDEGLLPSNG